MKTRFGWFCWVLVGISLSLACFCFAEGAEITLVRKRHDPYGAPRPAHNQKNVPPLTSIYFELAVGGEDTTDLVLPESVSISLQPTGGEAFEILKPGEDFAEGYTGRIFPAKGRRSKPTLAVYVDSRRKLLASTTYTIRVKGKSRDGAELSGRAGAWRFTTEEEPKKHQLAFELSLNSEPVRWKGAFFSGFCKPSFCTSSSNRIPGYELMDQVRKWSPNAWSLQRDFTLTGTDGKSTLLSPQLPGIVREKQTRRITGIEQEGEEHILHVEDFFGHQQYGIESGRPLSGDYQPGNEILIADGGSSSRAKVLSVNDKRNTVRVADLETPDAGWKLQYAGSLPVKENPDAPGLFPPGGCYLRKFKPSGTPAYYWKRLDHEWDLAHRRFRRRLMPNFTDAPVDLAIDGRSWTTAKDYAELHEMTRAVTSHIIERYGDAALDFPWSVFNEPDLMGHFWRSDWKELQKFYDYSVDAILRAFEDHGYDSDRVFVGGLELGAIFGTNLRLRDFLVHCSPRADEEGAVTLNAAYADKRLDGKRSQRVEKLCKAHDGKGSPCDFVSVHSYNKSQMTAAKLATAKQTALEIDPQYFAELWINSHESCPGWAPPPDPAFSDSYLGNGYFSTWCADVVRRQLDRASQDGRYAFGETILTFWPWPASNLQGLNACTQVISVDDDGNGSADRKVTVALPILHYLGLLANMGDEFRVLPERTFGGHIVSGFVSRTGKETRVLLYSHADFDTQSRSEREFEITLTLTGVERSNLKTTEYRFDKEHNSYYRRAQILNERRDAEEETISDKVKDRLEAAIKALQSEDVDRQLQALRELNELGPAAKKAGRLLPELIQNSDNERLRSEATATLFRLAAPKPFPAENISKIEELSKLQVTGESIQQVSAGGQLQLKVTVAANGSNFLVIRQETD